MAATFAKPLPSRNVTIIVRILIPLVAVSIVVLTGISIQSHLTLGNGGLIEYAI